MIPCTCIDSTNKPKEIPLSRWIQKGFIYHIIHIFYHPQQGIQGCLLREVSLGEECLPYSAYKLERFAFTEKEFEALIQLVKDCTELNDFDINELLKEVTHELQDK